MCSPVRLRTFFNPLRLHRGGPALLNPQSRQFIWRFARTYPGRTTLMVFLLILSGLAEGIGIAALLPVISAGMLDPSTVAGAAESSGDAISRAVAGLLEFLGIPQTLPALLATVVVAIFLKAGFRWLAMRQVGFSVAMIARDLRERLVRALMDVRWSYFVSRPVGYFPNAVSTEAQRSAGAYRRACSALAGLIQIPIYAGLIVAISWQIALASMILGAAATAVLGRFVGKSRKAGGTRTRRMKSMLAQITDALQSIKPIKAMGRESTFEDLVRDDIVALQEAEKRQVIASESLRSFQEPILILIIATGLWGATTFGNITFAEVMVIAFLFHRLAGRFHFVQLEYEMLATGESAFWSLEQLTAEAEAMAEPPSGSQEAPDLTQGIEFDRVSFAYGEVPVMSDISFTVPAGAFAAIVGPSGVGKTTILDLIAGLYQPDTGRILVDGLSLDSLDRTAWRRQIGYVPQDSVLFHDDVLRNVWVAGDEVDEELVREALEQADAWSFVRDLPDGLHTVLGERGAKLSGGQRQRIAIARALIGRPKLLMLDEATTALDPATEDAILGTLRKLRGKVTVLAISHQRALQGVADIVFQLGDSGIVETVRPPTPPRSTSDGATKDG
ncbi:MAG: ABC transporter ATP-binding protein [Longimicrobiales bacterium]